MIARTAKLSMLALSALCSACDDECGGTIEDLCEDNPGACKDHLTFDDALARALSSPPIDDDYFGPAYIAVCDDTRFVQTGDGLVSRRYSYAASGELIGTDSFSDAVIPGEECQDPEYGEGAEGPGCANPCTLYGSSLWDEEPDPPCEGAIAEPVIEACHEIAAIEYEQPACRDCTCSACYPVAVDWRRGELNDNGVLAIDECLKEHCAEPCEIRDDTR